MSGKEKLIRVYIRGIHHIQYMEKEKNVIKNIRYVNNNTNMPQYEIINNREESNIAK